MDFGGFDWDDGNIDKCQKHGVSIAEIEAAFEGTVLIAPDVVHSLREERFKAIGTTSQNRKLFIAFTVRHKDSSILIRPVSARYMHQKELKQYEKDTPYPYN